MGWRYVKVFLSSMIKKEWWPALRVLCSRERIQEGKKDSTRETSGKRNEKGFQFNFSFLS